MAVPYAQRRDAELAIPTLVAALVLGSGIFLSSRALKSSRPDTRTVPAAARVSGQTATAQLWEDPFVATAKDAAAVNDALSKALGDEAGTSNPVTTLTGFETSSIQRLSRGKDDASNLILPVFVPGGPYPENSEQRLRMRYALLTSLGVAGYVPADADRLGLLTIDLSKETDEAFCGPRLRVQPAQIPFEWYVAGPREPSEGTAARAELAHRRVLVLWVSDLDIPGKEMLWSLGRVFSSLEATLGRGTDAAVIGPYDSDDLVDLERSLHSGALPLYFEWTTFTCATATISETDIRITLSLPERGRLKIDADLGLVRTACTDDYLTNLLAQELLLRGLAKYRKGKFRDEKVVLVNEYDTSYSRRLAKSFKRSFEAALNKLADDAPKRTDSPGGEDRDNVKIDDWIDRYSYFRGLDGLSPGAASRPSSSLAPSAARSLNPFASAATPSPARDARDLADSTSQFDYLRRLCDRIKDDERDEKRRVRAIGIIGSDVYDKLLILQALRPSFPGAVFFTTDLDARLTHSSQYEWTRNLVIASSYDLRLGREMQVHAPSFRDTYQTSLYVAALRAVGATVRNQAATEALEGLDANSHLGRTYEIARSGHFELTRGNTVAAFYPDPQKAAAVPGIRNQVAAGLAAVFILLGVSLCVALAPAVSRRRDILQPRAWVSPIRRTLVWFIGSVAAVAATFGLISYFTNLAAPTETALADRAEPFAWFEGISAWPTIIFRILAAAIAIIYSIRLLLLWRSNLDDLSHHFKLPGPAAKGPHKSAAGRIDPFIATWTVGQTHDADQLWSEYRFKGSILARLLRTAVMTAIFFLVSKSLFQALVGSGSACIRGDVADNWNTLTRSAAPACVAFLAFLVWDAIRLCDRLVHQLSHQPTHYSPSALEEVRTRTGFHGLAAANRLDIDIIAARTACIGKAVYYPLVALFMLILSRNARFDNWTWSIATIIPPLLTLGVTVLSAWTLDRSAAAARQREIAQLKAARDRLAFAPPEALPDRLRDTTTVTRWDPAPSNGDAAAPAPVAVAVEPMREPKPDTKTRDDATAREIKLLEAAIKSIEEVRDGAFDPIRSRPIVSAIILPIGTVLGFTLLDALLSRI